jgi:hypothetical protein
MNTPYYIPKYFFNKANPNFNKLNFNNTLHQSPYQAKKIVPKVEMIDLTELDDSDEDNINNITEYNYNDIQNKQTNERKQNILHEEEDESSSESLESNHNFNSKMDKSKNNNFINNNINNNEIFELKLKQPNEKTKTVLNLNNSIFRNNININMNIFNNIYDIKDNNINSGIYNDYNSTNNKNGTFNNNNILLLKKQVNGNLKKNEIKITFDQSLTRMKNNFNKLFSGKNNQMINEDNIFQKEKFRNNLKDNNSMKLIFEYHDIIKELYENKIETKIVEKICDINRIIDNYMNIIRKLGEKRKIVVKDYKNYIFVIGVEMMINKKDKQAKEFIVKKKTETYKGNYKIITQEDDCYIIEINSLKRIKQTYVNVNSITIALAMLIQKMQKDAVNK